MLCVTLVSAVFVGLVSSISDEELAQRFAPVLYFDDAADTFPMDAEVFYQWQALKNTGVDKRNYECYTTHETDDEGDDQYYCENTQKPLADIYTYYQVEDCDGAGYRIVYWWFYGNQPACWYLDGPVEQQGSHIGDWERIIVTVSSDLQTASAVTYHQHGGFLTRLAGNIPTWNSDDARPIVWVGKWAHGSYPNNDRKGALDGIQECLYYGDYRNSDEDSSHWDTTYMLVDLSLREQTWMSDSSFYYDIGTKPQNIDHSQFCSISACDSEDQGADEIDRASCLETDCPSGYKRLEGVWEPVTGSVIKDPECYKCSSSSDCDCGIVKGYCCDECWQCGFTRFCSKDYYDEVSIGYTVPLQAPSYTVVKNQRKNAVAALFFDAPLDLTNRFVVFGTVFAIGAIFYCYKIAPKKVYQSIH